ncbi:hypothetical protein Lbuc_1432 [Lentilactobacillus buchneri NRRL B-30929]|nr:hypothetical protein Lbuc_1432 [Lentilactobacillus buchneri NRRL B-30929]
MSVKTVTIQKYVCDRCGKQYTPDAGFFISDLSYATENSSSEGSGGMVRQHLSLCEDCSYKFDKFMNMEEDK